MFKANLEICKSEGYRIWKSYSRLKMIQEYLESEGIKKLHIGAGPNILEGWLNADIKPQSNSVIYLDITKELPFLDRTFDYLYSEHVIEHVSYTEGIYHLKECYRILKPGGRLRIATPDLGFLIGLYNMQKTEAQKEYIKWAIERFSPEAAFHHETFVINNFVRCWGHQFIYDSTILELAFKGAGFEKIVRCKVMESDDPQLYNVEHHGNSIPEEFNQLETMVFEGHRLR